MIAQQKPNFPLTELVSPLVLFWSKVKFSVFCCLFLMSILTLKLFGGEYPENPQLGLCSVSRSTKVSAIVFQDFLGAVNSHFNQLCKTVGVLVDEPFSNSSKGLFESGDRIGFWIDMELGGNAILVRGIDFESRLYWGQVRSGLPSVRSLAADQIATIVNQLLDSFPYRGILSSDEFFSWNPSSGPLASVKRAAVLRHPFLPFWLSEPKNDQVIERGLSIHKSKGQPSILKSSSTEKPAVQQQRWLVLDSEY